MRIFAVATNKKVCDNIYVTGFNLNVIKMIPFYEENNSKNSEHLDNIENYSIKNLVGYAYFPRCNT